MLPAAPVRLVEDGKSDFKIVIAPDARPAERWAAEEFAATIATMTGADLPIDIFSGELPANAVIIGAGPHLESAGIHLDEPVLGPEGYRIVAHGSRLVIAGQEERGTMYGVFDVLQGLGCRWWTLRESTIPQTNDITIAAMDRTSRPAFIYRDLMTREAHDPAGQEWMARNRMNGMIWKDPPAKLGGRFRFGGGMLAHSLMNLMKKHREAITPEMMSADESGQRAKPGSRGHQLCFTNEDAIQAMARVVVAEYRADPEIAFVMLGQEDGFNYCHCTNCQKIAQQAESQSGPVVHFANEVVSRARETIPQAKVAVNAYVWSRQPPVGLRLQPGVGVVIASYECDFATPFAESEHWPNLQFKQDLEGWARLTDELYVWDYMTNFFHYLMPNPNLDVQVANLRYYREHGVDGVMAQGSWDGRFAEMTPLRSWVLAQAMWNPDLDSDTLIREFLEGYYGVAVAPQAQAYLDAIHRWSREDPKHILPIYRHTNAPHIAPDIIANVYGPIQQALAAAKASDDLEIIHRANHLAMPIHYVMLKMGPGSPMWRAVEAQQGPIDAEALAASFNDAITHYGVNVVTEGAAGKPFFEWVTDYGSLVAKVGVPAPPSLRDADWTRVRLIQGCQTDRGADNYARAEGASDGWAIQPGFGKDKLLHYLSPYNDFAEGKAYRAFARLRATGITDQAEGDIAAFSIGDQTVVLDAALLRDGQWHTVEVGEIHPEGAATAVRSTLYWRNRDALDSYAIDCFWIEESGK